MTTNTLFPGRDNYTGPTTGLFGLLHHEVLFESSHNVLERVEYVKNHKPKREVAIRLHNMIYLGECPAAARLAPLDADYDAKRAGMEKEVLGYIKTHIPDCAWNGQTLVFEAAQ